MDIEKLEKLIDMRKRIDAELVAIVTGKEVSQEKRTLKCGHCGKEGHNKAGCPDKDKPALTVVQ